MKKVFCLVFLLLCAWVQIGISATFTDTTTGIHVFYISHGHTTPDATHSIDYVWGGNAIYASPGINPNVVRGVYSSSVQAMRSWIADHPDWLLYDAPVSNIGGTTTANASTTITGSGTSFTTTLNRGDRISLSSAPTVYSIVLSVTIPSDPEAVYNAETKTWSCPGYTCTTDTTVIVDQALGDGTSQTINKVPMSAQYSYRAPIVDWTNSSAATAFANYDVSYFYDNFDSISWDNYWLSNLYPTATGASAVRGHFSGRTYTELFNGSYGFDSIVDATFTDSLITYAANSKNTLHAQATPMLLIPNGGPGGAPPLYNDPTRRAAFIAAVDGLLDEGGVVAQDLTTARGIWMHQYDLITEMQAAGKPYFTQFDADIDNYPGWASSVGWTTDAQAFQFELASYLMSKNAKSYVYIDPDYLQLQSSGQAYYSEFDAPIGYPCGAMTQVGSTNAYIRSHSTSVSIVNIDGGAQINPGINDSVTTISVPSTIGFASSGTIVIESEQITYSGKTDTSFTGCGRGANGTSATSHAVSSVAYNLPVSVTLPTGTFTDLYGTPVSSPVSMAKVSGKVLLLAAGNLCTPPDAVTGSVETGAVTNVKATTLTLAGTVTNTGGGTVSQCGAVWVAAPGTPTIADSKTEDSCTTTGPFSSAIVDLNPCSSYNLRSYVTNDASPATGYGAIVTVKPRGACVPGDWTIDTTVDTVTPDASSYNQGSCMSCDTKTIQITTGSQANRYLVISIHSADPSATFTGTPPTYNGDALTQLKSEVDNYRDDLWGLKNPDIGTNDLVVTASGSITYGLWVGGVVFYNVDQTTSTGTAVAAHGASTAVSVTATGASTYDKVFDTMHSWIFDNTATTATVGASQTQLGNVKWRSDFNLSAASYENAVSGSVPMTWTLSNSMYWTNLAVPLLHSASGSGAYYVPMTETPYQVKDASGVVLTPVAASGGVCTLTDPQTWCANGTNLYVRVTGGGNPGAATIYCSAVAAPMNVQMMLGIR